MDNDFLNWLSNNIFSGIGLPSAYLTEVENVDFAKTLAMQNSRFIRSIVGEQVTFGFGYSELVRKLFLKEHPESVDPKAGEKGDDRRMIDVNSIEVKFPSPVSLNMTNLNDQIANLNTLIDEISDVIDVPEADRELAKPIFKREMLKKYLANLDWDEMEEIMTKVKLEVVKTKIKTAPAVVPVDPSMEGDGSEEGAEEEEPAD